MTEIASLGLRVDATQVTSATTALNRLTASAKPAAAAATTLANAAKPATANLNRMSFEAKNLSFQLVDVGQGLLSGQSAMMIFAQQAGQIGQIIGTSNKGLGGLLKEVGASLRGLLTPATVAVGGLAALGVGAYAAYQSWKTFALQLDDTAHIAGTTSSAMAKLQAAASFKGIGQDDFAKGMGGFSQQIYLAKQNMGGLIDVLRANGVSAAGDFTTLLGKAADLIKNASSDQQRLVLLQQMGLPATMEWLRLLQGGAAGIKNATDAAVEFGGAANDNLVKKAREADEAWNHFWTNFGQKAKQYTVDAAGGISDFIDRVKNAQLNVQLRGTRLQGATPLGTDFDAFYKATGADRPNGLATLDKDKVRNDIALAQTRLGPLGQTPTVKELAVPDQSPQRKAA